MQRQPIKIMFVCHGNICRSPMAEFVLKDMVSKKYGKDALIEGRSEIDNASFLETSSSANSFSEASPSFYIESSATSTEELGNPPHPGTIEMLDRAGISSDGKYARQIKASEYDDFDMFIGMDQENIYNLKRIFNGDPDGKIYKMLEFAGSNRNVADPWYTGNFQVTYDDIVDGCVGLLAYIEGSR